jgi:hypothetical protein
MSARSLLSDLACPVAVAVAVTVVTVGGCGGTGPAARLVAESPSPSPSPSATESPNPAATPTPSGSPVGGGPDLRVRIDAPDTVWANYTRHDLDLVVTNVGDATAHAPLRITTKSIDDDPSHGVFAHLSLAYDAGDGWTDAADANTRALCLCYDWSLGSVTVPGGDSQHVRLRLREDLAPVQGPAWSTIAHTVLTPIADDVSGPGVNVYHGGLRIIGGAPTSGCTFGSTTHMCEFSVTVRNVADESVPDFAVFGDASHSDTSGAEVADTIAIWTGSAWRPLYPTQGAATTIGIDGGADERVRFRVVEASPDDATDDGSAHVTLATDQVRYDSDATAHYGGAGLETQYDGHDD